MICNIVQFDRVSLDLLDLRVKVEPRVKEVCKVPVASLVQLVMLDREDQEV